MTKISIYQVIPRLFGNKTTNDIPFGSREYNGVGKLNHFTPQVLNQIKDLGITHVWYTGIIEHTRCQGNPEFGLLPGNPTVIKGRAGSPYAINDYYDVDPDLAVDINNRINEFKQLVKRTHDAGLKVIIDFVPNHVARNYSSDIYPETNFGANDNTNLAFSPNNDFYYIVNQQLELPKNLGTILPGETVEPYIEYPAKATGNDRFIATPGSCDWYETIKLNYGVDYNSAMAKHFDPIPPVWTKMVNILLYWANMGVDGFRCDMAEMVPVEFWAHAIGILKQKNEKIIFIAEVYNPQLYSNYLDTGKFDYLYDKVGLYDTLRSIIAHGYPASEITKCWQALNGLNNKMLRFLENHDEHRITSTFFAGDAFKAIPAFIVCATMHNGPVMVYFGQEFGENAKGDKGYSGDDGRTSIFDYTYVPTIYNWLLSLENSSLHLPDNVFQLKKQYKKILNTAILYNAFYDGKFYDLMWDNNFDGGPNKNYIFAYVRYNNKQKLLVIVNFCQTQNQTFLLKIPANLINDMQFELYNNLVFKPIIGNVNQFSINVAHLFAKGIWININENSGLIYQILPL